MQLRVSPNKNKTFFYEQQKQNELDDFSKKEENMVIISIRTPVDQKMHIIRSEAIQN